MYWGDGKYGNGGGVGVLKCWDFALNNWCANWTSTGISDTNYQIAIDPTNEYCIWSNADDGIVQTYDGLTGAAGACGIAPSTVSFTAANSVPRMACNDPAPVKGWKSFALTSATTYTSATLTVKNSAGVAITGWTNIAIPSTKIVDLSTLTLTQTGQNPSFSVTFVGRSVVNT
mgnify:CR=1 FL=1